MKAALHPGATRINALALAVIPLAVIVSLAPLWPVYATTAAVIVVAAGVILGTTIAAVSVRFSWSLLRTTLVTLAVFAVVGVPLAIPSKTLFGVVPTFDGLLSLASAVVLSWKQLVTVVTPVASYEALLVPALILSLVDFGLIFLPVVVVLAFVASGPGEQKLVRVHR